jgi:pyruvate ferredoxin oxidoreductase beta subunit
MDLRTLTRKIQSLRRFTPGHRTCAGCAIPIIVRTVLAATNKPVIVGSATSCLEVTSTLYPYTSWQIPWIHNAFENVAATISGVESAYRALQKKSSKKEFAKKFANNSHINSCEAKFLAIAGDGGTYDIGLQSLSGALERNHNFVFLCCDNEAYMNTGGQRSSATPYGAATTTTPEGKIHHGKELFKKDIMKIVLAHNIPYAAQSAVHHWQDLYQKAKKAFEIKGAAFLNVLSPCNLNWKFPSSQTIKISQQAVETCFWPLYEVERGKYKINFQPAKKLPITEFLKSQGRFKHLFKPENKKIIKKIQKHVDEEWERLLELSY